MSKNVTINDIADSVNTEALLKLPLTDWRPILTTECGVYVYNETYLAKRFDGINYKFCEKDTAKEILIDNLYALLRFKYFPKASEEVDERINQIVKSFTANLKTTLRKVSFDNSSDSIIVKLIPDYCIAFRNGVYDFLHDKWLFKYSIVDVKKIANKLYIYDPSYIIQWYLDYDFEPLPIQITNTKLADFVDFMKSITKDPKTRNFCFELVYNMAHDEQDLFSMEKFEHLSQILGYLMLQSFSQYFIFLIGSGQNGKNSLFDGCLTNRLIPRPASNSLDSIEQDRFITGALENKAHNIFLETSPKTYTQSTMIKALTGSMYQTIESKGVSKYSGIINCKYLFSGNDQDRIKFSDNTHGFRRRINMFEVYYQWDDKKKFMSRGDYYDTTFSDSLTELKQDITNTTAFVYLAMYGIMIGTKNFTQNFKLIHNDWRIKYADIDSELKERIERLSAKSFVSFVSDPLKADYMKTGFYDINKSALYRSPSIKAIGLPNIPESIKTLFEDENSARAYFSEQDILITTQVLKEIIRSIEPSVTFSQKLKQMYGLSGFITVGANKSAVKCSFSNGRLRIVK